MQARKAQLLTQRNHTSLRVAQLVHHHTMLFVVDVILAVSALLIGLRLGASMSGWVFSTALIWQFTPWLFALTTLYFFLATANDVYRPRVFSDQTLSFLALLKTSGGILLLYALLYASLPPFLIPRHFVGFFGLFSLLFLSVWRWIYHFVFSSPVFHRRAIVVGAGWSGQTIVKTVKDLGLSHFDVVGFVDDDAVKQETVIQGKLVLGTTQALPDLARKEKVTDIVLAITNNLQDQVLTSVLTCHEQGIMVSTMSDVYERLTNRIPVEHIGESWVVALPFNNSGRNLLYRAVKRLTDLVMAIIGLTLFSLILPLLALAIRLDSAGPVFYRQRRVGRHGQTFELIKLRSMVADAEKDGQARWADANDDRVTRVGLFMRRTRLDEVPQLINVLRGEMSLIGPRPERPEFVTQLQEEIPFYRTRLTVKPGLTGWAQVNYDYGRSAVDALEKLRYDLYYIKHQSFQLDLVILLKTIGTVVMLKGT